MTRLAIGAVIGIAVGVVVGAAMGIRAEQWPTEETVAVADEAGVDAWLLQAASNTTGLQPRDYLIAVGELARPVPPPLREYAYGSYPRLAPCIEQIVKVESHGWFTGGWNPVPWGRWGEHASGLGGFLPSTWMTTPQGRAGLSIWDGPAQVDAIAFMLRAGRGREFAAYAWGRCS